MSDNAEQTGGDDTLVAQRKEKLASLRASGRVFGNDFRPSALADTLQRENADCDGEALDARGEHVAVAGRVLARRVMGRLSFATLQDRSGKIQLMVMRDALGDDAYQAFKSLDIGDILGVEGTLTRTNKGELSVRADRVELLTKSLRPLPEKWHGLTDREARYRQRYVDLIMNPDVRSVFAARSALIHRLRSFFVERDFLEVETPMLQAIPGGAAARPFVTHYNALEHDFYLRVAPELYLKRLVVGGLERVFEVNRNFRNEGLSTRHNPEFTMLEFYQAYADYADLMDLIESLLGDLSQLIRDTHASARTDEAVDLGRDFERLTMTEAVARYAPGAAATDLTDQASLARLAGSLGIDGETHWDRGQWLTAVFESAVESKLEAPTFITDYPASVSPLARRRDDDPEIAERFELFVAGREIANGFSELNDAEDQAERFRAQAASKAGGDDEAMYYDADYVEALEYGLPPTAGAGIGIDRLLMLLTGQGSIRDVLLFPQLRPEK
ncbi:lysine--tRNA ligase [Salinisphaera sp. USBA-960]|uniref:lysine--tRNA ligase n=1 Tax=Salinisphaera orenii TaxID=856731 RepID=UPI000DBE6E43|nr:lysine--tRNA ligase [Salifodinibacter halophilus]NNC26065.1 lysine--tRNA ligase [Salifodinibacter halophilus]